MAAPIAHIFLAIKILSGALSECKFNEREFVIGTSFPDIRYLGLIKREQTHYKGLTLQDIKDEKNSFKAGMLFHSFVDELREKYIVKNEIYEMIPKFKYITQCLKFSEDSILMDYFNPNQYSIYFDDILKEELDFNINLEDITKWHKFLQLYLKLGPVHKVLKTFYFSCCGNSFIKKFVFYFQSFRINSFIKKIQNNEKIKKIILDFYLNFESFIKADELNQLFINASNKGDINEVMKLIDQSIDINCTDIFGRTALHQAVFNGHKNIVIFLLEKGANINLKDIDGRTALNSAVFTGNKDMISFLLQNGADINIKDKYGKTVLDFAISTGNNDMVEFLRKA